MNPSLAIHTALLKLAAEGDTGVADALFNAYGEFADGAREHASGDLVRNFALGALPGAVFGGASGMIGGKENRTRRILRNALIGGALTGLPTAAFRYGTDHGAALGLDDAARFGRQALGMPPAES